jgi:Tfp pilus assembly protein PilN
VSQQQINLYQPIFRKQEKKFSTVAMLQAAGIVAAGIVLMYGYSWWRLSALQQELQRAQQNQAAAARRLAEVSEKFGRQRTGTALDEEIVRLERELVAKQRIQQLLQRGVFSNTRGFSDYLVSLARQHVPGVWLTGFDITGAAEELSLSGRSTDPELVPRYMQRLSSEKPLSGLEFRVFQMSRSSPDPKEVNKTASEPYVEFQVKTSANPGPS